MRIAEAALLLVALLGSAFAGQDKRAEAEALFARANGVLGFGGPASGPYTVKGYFRLASNQLLYGTFLKVVLRESEVWRNEISLPGYSEVVVMNGDRKWVRRNAAFTPLRVRELLAALQPHLKVNEKENVERVTEEMVGTTQARCVKLRTKEWAREVCMDATTGLPLCTKYSFGRKQVDYEGYSSAGGKQFPMKVRLSEAGNVVAEFWLDSLSVDVPDRSLFDPLPGAVVWPTCDKPKPPVPISTPDPHYAEIDRRARVEGVVVLQVVIDEQGHTHDAAVTRSLTPGLDGEAKAAVLKWRFQPAMCGSAPIPFEMNIEVSFRLGH